MPELPEAQTIASDLNRRVAGLKIGTILVKYRRILGNDTQEDFQKVLTGQTIAKVSRLGKMIRFDLQNKSALFVQLKMTGQFITGPWPGTEDGDWPPHAQVAFELLERPQPLTLFYKDVRKFGTLWAVEASEVPAFVQGLRVGPDPLGLTAEIFHSLLTSKRGQLKATLLDQNVVSGLGNIYVDESLFAAKLSPLRPVGTLSAEESTRLLSEVKRILNASIEQRGSTVVNYQGLEGPGSYQNNHQVYGRAKGNCLICNCKLEKITVSGRGTVYCPNCQT
jgi:formamidopyrimidine-DNA glycosylase